MVSFSLNLLHALDDWNEYIDQKAQQRWTGDDEDLATALRHLNDVCCVNFKDFLPDEVLSFMLKTFPRKHLFTIGKRRSAFLSNLFKYWQPELHVWAAILWRFTAKSCSLFGQVISANPGIDKDNPKPGRNPACLGLALFRHLPRMPSEGLPLTEGALQNAIGSLVRLPLYDSLVRLHEEDILHYTQFLSPAEIGQVCQRLLMFRARPKNCMCGWGVREIGCACELKLELDPSKEYAFALFRLIGERHSGDCSFQDRHRENPNACPPSTWTAEDEAQFLRAACNVVFSAGAYKEIYQNLHLDKRHCPNEPPLPTPRKLSDNELTNNYTRHQDGDYTNAVSRHGGCVHRNCKQNLKKDCANVSCKSHCNQSGMLQCMSHNNPGIGLPNIDLRTPVQVDGRSSVILAMGNTHSAMAAMRNNGRY